MPVSKIQRATKYSLQKQERRTPRTLCQRCSPLAAPVALATASGTRTGDLNGRSTQRFAPSSRVMMSPDRMLWLLVTLASLVVVFVLVAFGVHLLFALGVAYLALAAGLHLVGDE
jgi:hypothetical protein